MQVTEVGRLKIQAEKFYLDLHPEVPQMSDAEYDELARQYENETGKSIKDLIDWNSIGSVEHIKDLSSLRKTQVQDNDLKSSVMKWIKETRSEKYYLNLKYDGGGIRAYYKEGKLQKVVSLPDESKGLLKTNTLGCLFPQTLEDKTIESLVGELVTDPQIFGANSRNKSNGLINSKNQPEDVKKYAMVRIYRITFNDQKEYDFDRQSEALSNLPALYDENGKCYFKEAVRLSIDQIPTSAINNVTGEWMQADGVVIYSEKDFHAMKFYYNESKDVVIKKITYKLQKTGNLYPLIWFDPVQIDNKWIRK